jgi:hypothetical protein
VYFYNFEDGIGLVDKLVVNWIAEEPVAQGLRLRCPGSEGRGELLLGFSDADVELNAEAARTVVVYQADVDLDSEVSLMLEKSRACWSATLVTADVPESNLVEVEIVSFKLGESSPRGAREELTAIVAVRNLADCLEQYLEESHSYPGLGGGVDYADNQLPKLLDALVFLRPKDAPQIPLRKYDFVVEGATKGVFVAASPEDLENPGKPKYILDPWGHPYVYRLAKAAVGNGEIQTIIYSAGPNGKEESQPAMEGMTSEGSKGYERVPSSGSKVTPLAVQRGSGREMAWSSP